MSHVSVVKTTIRDLAILKQALKDLGLGYYEGQSIKGSYIKENDNVDLVIDNKGDQNIGLVKDSDGIYNFKGDFYRVNKNFTNEIVQKYTVLKIRSELRKMGASGIQETSLEDGSVKLTANL